MTDFETGLKESYRESIEQGKLPGEIVLRLEVHKLPIILGFLSGYVEMAGVSPEGQMAKELHSLINGQTEAQVLAFQMMAGGKPS